MKYNLYSRKKKSYLDTIKDLRGFKKNVLLLGIFFSF